MKIRSATLVLAIVTILFVSGCRTVTYVPGMEIRDEALARSLRESAIERFPQQFRAVHRAVLTVRNRQFNLEGYLRGDRSGAYRFVATTGFGSSMFGLSWREDTGVSVVSSNEVLTDAQLIAGPGEDIRSMYFRWPSESAHLSSRDTEYWALTDVLPDGTLEEFQFERRTRNLVRYLRSEKGRIYYTMEFNSWSATDGELPSSPRQIHMENTRFGYEVDIQVIDFRADEFDLDALVKAPTDGP